MAQGSRAGTQGAQDLQIRKYLKITGRKVRQPLCNSARTRNWPDACIALYELGGPEQAQRAWDAQQGARTAAHVRLGIPVNGCLLADFSRLAQYLGDLSEAVIKLGCACPGPGPHRPAGANACRAR